MHGKDWVRLAQLRARIAAFARGGQYGLASQLLGELARADVTLGLPADGLLRTRQRVALAEASDEPTAGPLAAMASALLVAGDLDAAVRAAELALVRAREPERDRVAALAYLVIGAVHRRRGELERARAPLDVARATAAKLGQLAIAGLALIELGWVDLATAAPAPAATCFQFAAEFLRRATRTGWAVEADALAIVALAEAGDLDAATARAGGVADAARDARRPELVAMIDGALAELAVAGALAELALPGASDAAAEACALAAESAMALSDSRLARDLRARARLRQVRIAEDDHDRARHLEAGIEIALTLPVAEAGARLGSLLLALVDAGAAGGRPIPRADVVRLADVIARLGDPELAAIAAGVVAELAR